MNKQTIGELEHTEKYIPRLDEIYCYIDIYGDITTISNTCTTSDEWIIKHNHVFRSEEDCEIYRAYLELLDEYTFELDWNDSGQRKHYIYYSHSKATLDVDYHWRVQTGMYHFESEEKAREFIEKAGEQNIKRFMFDIWE